MQNRKLFKVPEVAELLGLSRSLAYSLVMGGQIASVKIGRARRIPGAAIDAFIERLSDQQAGSRAGRP